MDVILDTCALLSLIGLTPKQLSKETQREIKVADRVYVSSCTMVEIAIKHQKRGLDLGTLVNPAQLWNRAMNEYQLTEVPVSHDVFYQSVLLPEHHADPFDRIIIAQARKLEVPVVTFDSTFALYDLSVIA